MSKEALLGAVDQIEDADPKSVSHRDDGNGHFVIDAGVDEVDFSRVDELLEDAGFIRYGGLEVPGMVQVNYEPEGDDGDE